jgi:hypothetical protein
VKFKKIIYRPVSREDISNPLHMYSYEELLVKEEAIDLRNNLVIKTLPNGRIKAEALNKKKRFK